MSAETPREGWMVFKNPLARRYHYIVGNTSLCGRLGFYMEDLSQPNPDQKEPGREDCAECFRRLSKKLACAAVETKP